MASGPDIWKVLVGVAIATGISFAIASPIVKMAGGKTSLEDAQAEMAAMKAEAKGEVAAPVAIKDASEVKKTFSHVMQEWVPLLWEQQNSVTV